MYEVPAIIGACTNCIAPGSLVATFATILVGAVIAIHSQRRNQSLMSVKTRSERGRSLGCDRIGDWELDIATIRAIPELRLGPIYTTIKCAGAPDQSAELG